MLSANLLRTMLLVALLFSRPLAAQSLDCFTFVYYIASSGQFIEASSELTVGEKVKTDRRACVAGEEIARPPVFERIDRQEVEPSIARAAQAFKVNPNLVRSIIHVESDYRPSAVSPKGAKGLMQLMDATAQQYNVVDSFDTDANIYAGTNHFSDLMERFDDNVEYALAAYNAGSDAVIKHNGIPPFKETQAYVTKVVTFFNALEADTPAAPSGGNQTQVSGDGLRNQSIEAFKEDSSSSENPLPDRIELSSQEGDILKDAEILNRKLKPVQEPGGG